MGNTKSQQLGQQPKQLRSPSKVGPHLQQLEARCGKIAVSGRYHRLPKKIHDDYVVEDRVLGSGYNGAVLSARSKSCCGPTGQKYAVKAFDFSKVDTQTKVQFQAEVEIFLCMDHPHITRLYDVYESEEHTFLVMECMEGGELFDRVAEQKRFSDRDAADAVSQILLALNYIHSHGIVHRDIKLENFLYDSKGSNYLKLIDFGFSNKWEATSQKMHVSCGTLSYCAPEVLNKCYTSQCDLWSLGVIAFILLSGYMPFSGSEDQQARSISKGNYFMKPDTWSSTSEEAKEFVSWMLQVDPDLRMSAAKALEHRWIKRSMTEQKHEEIGFDILEALRKFGHASKFRRACMEMMAWSLSGEERAKVQDCFLQLDQTHCGTITLAELKRVLSGQFHVSDAETMEIFLALDTNHDEEIHYSDFLAAMVDSRIALHDDLVQATFKKFDVDNSGYITSENLREILGDTFEGDKVEHLLAEGGATPGRGLSYAEFGAYLRQEPVAMLKDKSIDVSDVDTTISQGKWSTSSDSAKEMSPSSSIYSKGAKSGNQGDQGCCCIS